MIESYVTPQHVSLPIAHVDLSSEHTPPIVHSLKPVVGVTVAILDQVSAGARLVVGEPVCTGSAVVGLGPMFEPQTSDVQLILKS